MRIIVSVLIFQAILSPSYCQSILSYSNNSSLFSNDTIATGMYKRIMDHTYDVVNGREYLVYHNIYKSNPFFKSSTTSSGTIFNDGRTYTDLHILFDIYKDELILNYLNSDGYLKLISLNKNCLDSFLIITDNVPVMIQILSFPETSGLKTGFYEQPYKGKTQLLIKHKKGLEKKGDYDNYFYEELRYLYINGTYNRIRSLHKFIKLFGDKSALINKFYRSIHVNSFREITDAELIRILRYYENL